VQGILKVPCTSDVSRRFKIKAYALVFDDHFSEQNQDERGCRADLRLGATHFQSALHLEAMSDPLYQIRVRLSDNPWHGV
jgi:hypothetical protein